MAGQNKREKKIISNIVLVLAIGVFIFSGYKLVGIFLEYHKGESEYESIRENVIQEETVTEQETTFAVDFAKLKEINSEVVAWIRFDEPSQISYPVVKGTDNNKYLHTTFEGKKNAAGTLFMDFENEPDFADRNTFIYGHNMKNGSMFGMLRKHFKDEASVPGKYIWICTPQQNYRYEIFSSHVVDAAGEVYTLFPETGEPFAEYLEHMVQQSMVDYKVPVTKDDKIITLSTCTGNDATRFVVQAKREGAY